MSITVKLDPAEREKDGFARILLSGPEISGIQLDLPFKNLHRSLGKPNQLALDLLVTAATCYVVDKSVKRRKGADVWTRELSVSIPVANAKSWANVATRLDSALSFLSGDVWETSFRQAEAQVFVAPRRRRLLAQAPNEPKLFHAATLLSGGLDSLIGAIDFLEQNPKSNLMLIGHYDSPGPKSQQQALSDGLKSAYPNRTKLLQVRVSHKPPGNAESSLRSRSIVFLALGLYGASQLGPNVPLLAPENGLIALNLPLTPSRIGSCSTRTMHPFYLTTLRAVIRDLGIKNELLNPLELKTKADCVSDCKNPDVLRKLAPKTVSCSHGTRRQNWSRRSVNNCGYCIPCLFRRAALHEAKLDSGSDYGIDVCTDERPSNSHVSSEDILALTSALQFFKTNGKIERAIMGVAAVEPLKDYVAMVNRGFDQVRDWITAKGSASLRKEAGLK